MYIQKRYQLNSFICYSLTIIIYNIYKNELIWKKKIYLIIKIDDSLIHELISYPQWAQSYL